MQRSAPSRRAFIKGVIASGAAASAAGYLFRGPGVPVGLCAGRRYRRAAGDAERQRRQPSRRRAAAGNAGHTIRYKLGLTGTKLGCDHGECGACTVIIDGTTVYSCSTLTHSVRDRKITTIEGIEGPNGKLHKVQAAFVAELGPQCGFCTSGQVMAAVALLDHNPHPTVEEARLAMSGNLCRCGAYDHYLKGVMRAAREA